ncbi:MAG: UDP-N-acetylmuramyl-tripeptide synthetase [Candidatus Roizmanbacteria bacterium]|nr:MAG: UDP-N-acetylmuramyl-tripeptide synthetase [Candidatus Roizmanbacteria bacterium]
MSNFKFQIQKLKNFYHLLQSILANVYYGFPSKKLKVIGITGTDGKTTTTHLVYNILISSGKKASMISTVYAKIGNEEYDTGLHTTTPNSFQIQKLLKKAVEAGHEYFVLETTSHALDQNRVFGINFEVSAITNISHEHFDYHLNFDNYLQAKLKLLLNSKVSLINNDDLFAKRIQGSLNQNRKKFYSLALKNKADFQFDYKSKYDQNLATFNNYNFLTAFSIAKLLGIDEEKIIKAMKSFTLPLGRYDTVYDKDFQVVVDFAHAPNAIGNVLFNLKERLKGNGKLIHVFGSAGNRDKSKRPIMGEESGKYADITILTEDDPRSEDVVTICKEISEGLRKYGFSYSSNVNSESVKKYTIIPDREKAIKKSLEIVGKGDIIALTGKGHERGLARKVEVPWNEKELVLKLLKEK